MDSGGFNALDEEFFREGDQLASEAAVTTQPVRVLRLPLPAPPESGVIDRKPARPGFGKVIAGAAIAAFVSVGVAAAIVRDGEETAALMDVSQAVAIAAPIEKPAVYASVTPLAAIADPEPAAAPEKKIEQPRVTPAERRRQAESLYAKGRAASIAGRFKESAAYFRRAAKADASFAKSYRALGLVYRQLGDRRRATAAFRSYLRAAPHAKDTAAIRRLLREDR